MKITRRTIQLPRTYSNCALIFGLTLTVLTFSSLIIQTVAQNEDSLIELQGQFAPYGNQSQLIVDIDLNLDGQFLFSTDDDSSDADQTGNRGVCRGLFL